MGVFPAASRSHIPAPWAQLMIDPVCSMIYKIGVPNRCVFCVTVALFVFPFKESTIIDFYPEDFQIDLNGKKQAWQGVALLPFVDEARLKRAVKPLAHLLTEDESKSYSLPQFTRNGIIEIYVLHTSRTQKYERRKFDFRGQTPQRLRFPPGPSRG